MTSRLLLKMDNIKNKTVALSGATGGIGRHLARRLLDMGANLIFLDRNHKKSQMLKNTLLSLYPNAQISLITVDMSDFNSVKSAADELLKLPIDVIIHNAGAYSIPRYICNTGYDNLFQINFLSPYYLTKRLLPLLDERGGSVVAVSSISHNYSKIDKSDLDFHLKKANSLAYGNAKRWLTFSLYSLFENTSSATLSITHPGITLTGITNHYPKLIFALIKHPMKLIFMSPKKASDSVLEGVFTQCNKEEWIGPKFFNIWGKPKKRPLKSCGEEEYRFIAAKAEEIYNQLEKVK